MNSLCQIIYTNVSKRLRAGLLWQAVVFVWCLDSVIIVVHGDKKEEKSCDSSMKEVGSHGCRMHKCKLMS